MCAWWETAIDAIPVVGTGYRTVNAVSAHISGNHDEAQKQWAEAGMNLAGDALGLVTGGAGKVATTAARAGAKTALKVATKQGVKAMTKQTLKQAAKQGSKAATRAARKQLTKKAMKKYAEKYVKKKAKRAIKKGIRDAMRGSKEEEPEYKEGELCIIEEMHRFSGHWKGFYRQYGTDHDVQFMLIIDQDGNMAGRGSDISRYIISGRIESDGTFMFHKQYEGPTYNHLVDFSGSVEWHDKPILQGRWTIPSDGQTDDFVIIADEIGMEASVISLCCNSAEEVLGMDYQQKRREIIGALSEIVLDMDVNELASLSDEELVNIAETLTLDELYEDSDEEDED